MAGTTRRQRQLAREHYERQQARRAAAAGRRRRRQQVLAVALVLVLAATGIVVLGQSLGDDSADVVAEESPTPTASATESGTEASPTTDEGCVYTGTGDAAADVGIPTFDAKTAAQPFTATIETNRGDITVDMLAGAAPCTTNSFRFLAEKGFYDDTSCHRLTTDNIFVLQCGDPTGSGGGGPGYRFGVENAPEDGVYPPGTLAMARTADPGSNGSQFFIVYEETRLPDPDGYTVFGRVTNGLDLVRQVAEAGVQGGGGDGKPAEAVTITSVRTGKGAAGR